MCVGKGDPEPLRSLFSLSQRGEEGEKGKKKLKKIPEAMGERGVALRTADRGIGTSGPNSRGTNRREWQIWP